MLRNDRIYLLIFPPRNSRYVLILLCYAFDDTFPSTRKGYEVILTICPAVRELINSIFGWILFNRNSYISDVFIRRYDIKNFGIYYQCGSAEVKSSNTNRDLYLHVYMFRKAHLIIWKWVDKLRYKIYKHCARVWRVRICNFSVDTA